MLKICPLKTRVTIYHHHSTSTTLPNILYCIVREWKETLSGSIILSYLLSTVHASTLFYFFGSFKRDGKAFFQAQFVCHIKLKPYGIPTKYSSVISLSESNVPRVIFEYTLFSVVRNEGRKYVCIITPTCYNKYLRLALNFVLMMPKLVVFIIAHGTATQSATKRRKRNMRNILVVGFSIVFFFICLFRDSMKKQERNDEDYEQRIVCI